MIEISPFVLRPQPSAISQQEHKVTFELSGVTLLDLAKSHFLQSFGYFNQESFPLTKGAFHALYRWLTTDSMTVKVIDMVWTTNPSPDYETLQGAIPPEKRKSAFAVRSREWCGFGDRGVCWHRFAMFEPTSR
jgi:hypothetical protein